MAISLKSPAFEDQEEIPTRYTGEGADISPPLRWSRVPPETREFALICEDPDAPQEEPFVHWLIYNISPNTTLLPEGVSPELHIDAPVRADQGENSFGEIGYGGPMPPIGHGIHRYIFRIFALNTELGLDPGATKQELLEAMDGHILDAGQLVGKYIREKIAPAA